MATENPTPRHILLAEDDPQDVELSLAALKRQQLGNAVTVVRDGAEALDYLYCRGKFKGRPSGLPVLILLDLKMPKVGGLEVLKIVKQDGELKQIPVVMLTSSREKTDLLECYQEGANAYVVKPVHFEEFMKSVGQAGVFWTAINEPPPADWREENGAVHEPLTPS